jgi:hypothetical protein
MRAEEYRREIEEIKEDFKVALDVAKDNAVECSKGCDELYTKMTKSVEEAYLKCK